MELVDPHNALQGNLWWALRGAHRLAGTPFPDATFDFDNAFSEGLTHLVSLTGTVRLDCSPLVGTAYELQDLYGELEPANPDLEWARVTTAATAVRALLDAGEGVLVHCLGGTGRTGTVIGAVLASYGGALDDIAVWLNDVHELRGHGWPECPWQRPALAVLE